MDLANWLKSVPNGTSLTELTIPGTHDTCASKSGGPSYIAQDLSLAEQLNLGIRFVDIRCRHYQDALPVHHANAYQGLDFGDVQKISTQFLTDHPTEFILMSIKDENTIVSPDSGNKLSYGQTFLNYSNTVPQYWYTRSTIPLIDDVRGKIVLLRRFSAESPLGIDASDWQNDTSFSIINPDSRMLIEDHYSVSLLNVNAKWQAILDNLAAAERGPANPNLNVMFITFLSAAVGATPATFADGILSFPGFNRLLSDRLDVINSGRLGVVAMDFPNHTAGLIEKLISFNPNHPPFDSFAFTSAMAPAACGRDDELFVVATDLQGAVWYNQAGVGGPFVGWQEIPGGLVTEAAPAAAMRGGTLFIFAKTADGQVQYNQAAAGGAFVGWQSIPGGMITDVAPTTTARADTLFVFAKDRNGRIFFNQAAEGRGFVGWQEMPGGLVTQLPLGAGMQGNTLFVFAITPDGAINFNQAAQGGAFVGWQVLAGATSDVAPASAGRANNLFVFVKDLGGQILFNQAAPGGAFVGWQAIPGGVSTKTAIAAAMRATTLFVIANSDQSLLYNSANSGAAFIGWQASSRNA